MNKDPVELQIEKADKTIVNKLDVFGVLISEELRDTALNRYLDIESGYVGTNRAKELHKKLSAFAEGDRELFRKVLTDVIDASIHDFLFAIQESHRVKVLVDDMNVLDLSDGLIGEILTKDGWFERFSQHKEAGI
jgi:hypothetical protein